MQDELVRSNNPFVRRIGALLAAGALDNHLSMLRDRQIAQLISDVVERDLRIASPEATICSQATKRLLRSPSGRLDDQESPRPVCPECGNEMLPRIGIDEPDSVECVARRCGRKEYTGNPEAK